ncbi:MAG: DNA-3-methyladenine glycosylase family protein [Aminivibrio sp.]
MTSLFVCGEEALAWLSGRDKKLGAAIERIGPLEREGFPDLFTALIRSIVSQQISKAAAATVWGRINDKFRPLTAETLLEASFDDIQSCGLSMRKVTYMQGIAEAALRGEINRKELEALDDDGVIKKLSTLKGVGVWTAEMLLIFTLGRPDVVSWGDLAIRRGMTYLYGHKELTRPMFERYRKRYSPYGSAASLYLWHIAMEHPDKDGGRKEVKGPVTM